MPKLAWLGALCICVAHAGFANDAGDYREDARDYVLAPPHRDWHDWLWAGEVAAATAVAYTLDSRVQQHFALKHTFERERPDTTMDSSSAWFSGEDSFPSGHTVAAFATAQAFADSRQKRQLSWRIGAYSLGALTAHARLRDYQHWLSDTGAGAVPGMDTVKSVAHRTADSADEQSTRIFIHPLKGGAMLTVSVDPARLFGW